MQPDGDLTPAYVNAERIPGGNDFPPRWREEARALRERLGERARRLRYGAGARQVFDLFLPEAAPRGLMAFVHGGYWRAFAPEDWSGFAEGGLARGWAVAMPGYTLAPEARIAAMTGEVEAAIGAAAAEVPEGPLVLSGHSAGGHLSARMVCTDRAPGWIDRVRRLVPISPLADLRPLMRTEMNATLRIDPAEAEAESPALLARREGIDVTVWVGMQERPAFVWQARLLSEEWDCPWHADPGRHHFDVIDGLRVPDSPLMKTLLDAL